MNEVFLDSDATNLPCADGCIANLVDLLSPLMNACPHCGATGDSLSVASRDWKYANNEYDEDHLQCRKVYPFHTQCACGVHGPETKFVNKTETPATLQDLLGTAALAVKAWNDLFARVKRPDNLFCEF